MKEKYHSSFIFLLLFSHFCSYYEGLLHPLSIRGTGRQQFRRNVFQSYASHQSSSSSSSSPTSTSSPSIFDALANDYGFIQKTLKELNQSAPFLTTIDYERQYLPIISTLINFDFPPYSIRWIIIKNPSIFLLSSNHLNDVLTYFQRYYRLSDKDIILIITKKPKIFQKTLLQLKEFLFFILNDLQFIKYKSSSSSLFFNLLYDKSYLWDCNISDMREYLHLLTVNYGLEMKDIHKILMIESCSIFCQDLLLNCNERIQFFRNFLGFHHLLLPSQQSSSSPCNHKTPALHAITQDSTEERNLNSRKSQSDVINRWKILCRNCPKILIMNINYLKQFIIILQQELQFDSYESIEFHQFIQSSWKLFSFMNLSLIRLRCQIIIGLFTNCYSDTRASDEEDIMIHNDRSIEHIDEADGYYTPSIRNFRTSYEKQQSQYVEEREFYHDYLSYLEAKSDPSFTLLPFATPSTSLTGPEGNSSSLMNHYDNERIQRFTLFIFKILEHYFIDFLPSARSNFLFSQKSSRRKIVIEEENRINIEKSIHHWEEMLFSYWNDIECIELSLEDSLKIIPRSAVLSHSLKDILQRIGLLTLSLALTTEEIEYLIKTKPT